VGSALLVDSPAQIAKRNKTPRKVPGSVRVDRQALSSQFSEVEESVWEDEPVVQMAGDGTEQKPRGAFGNKELVVGAA
jgi:hypothetical protein